MRTPLLFHPYILTLYGCTAGVAALKSGDHVRPEPVDSGQEDTSEEEDSDSGPSPDTNDTGPAEDSETPEDTGDSCEDCGGISFVDPAEVHLRADGSDASASVEVYGKTTGIELVCSEALVHLAWELDTADTRETGKAVITFRVTDGFSGSESGVCALFSDYGEPVTIPVDLSVCPDCTGITRCAEDDLILTTYSTSYPARSTECYGTATGIEVACATADGTPFIRVTPSLSLTDSSETGEFTLTVSGSDIYGHNYWGHCTLTDEQGSRVEICVWECNVSSCAAPC